MRKQNSKLFQLLPSIERNVLLKHYTSFKIGGKTKYFFKVKTKKDLIRAILTAEKLNLPFFILAGGSNLLMADKGYNGLVIKIKNTKYEILNTKIIAEAGTTLGQLVRTAINAGLTGLEWAIGIPGTIGGAIYGNAGAFGKSMKDITKTVTVLEIKNQKSKVKSLKNKECRFGYRDSIFKKNKNLIIISAVLQLKKGKKNKIRKKIKEYLNYKKERQPLNFPSAGSIFKNFTPHRNEVSGAGPREFKELKKFKKTGILPAAWLIEKCGLKGKRIGQAQISEKHANFIVNLGGAKAKDVKKLIILAKNKVKKKFEIILEEEIQIIP